MIKLTLDYQNGKDPRIVTISDTDAKLESLIVECAHSQMYDYFRDKLEAKDLDPQFKNYEDIIYTYAKIFMMYDVWDGWLSGPNHFDKYTKVEVV